MGPFSLGMFFDFISLLQRGKTPQANHGFLIKKSYTMAENGHKNLPANSASDCPSDEDIKELIEKYGVTEEDVNVAVHIVGPDKEKIEQYLVAKKNRATTSMW